MIYQHLLCCFTDLRIRNVFNIMEIDLIFTLSAFAEHIAVEIYLLEIREYCLAVFHHSQGVADLHEILFGMFQIVQHEVCKVDERIVIDLPIKIFSPQIRMNELSGNLLSLRFQHFLLTL